MSQLLSIPEEEIDLPDELELELKSNQEFYISSKDITEKDFKNDNKTFDDYFEQELSSFVERGDFNILYDYLSLEQEYLKNNLKDKEEVRAITLFLDKNLQMMFEYKFIEMNIPLIIYPGMKSKFGLEQFNFMKQEIEAEYQSIVKGTDSAKKHLFGDTKFHQPNYIEVPEKIRSSLRNSESLKFELKMDDLVKDEFKELLQMI